MATFTASLKRKMMQFPSQTYLSKEAATKFTLSLEGGDAMQWKTIIGYIEILQYKKEYIFIGMLVAAAAIMSPLAHVKVRETYQ